MKRYKFVLMLSTMLMSMVGERAFADVWVDGICYNLSGNNATVTKGDVQQGGKIVIPSSVNYGEQTYSVTSIGTSAFQQCINMSAIEIPNSVTSISNYAFEGCTSLASIEIPNSVISIGSDAFKYTPWYNNQPYGLVYAGKVAYKYKGTMPSETSIVLQEGTKSISDNAFNGCSGLVSIEIPNSITSIGRWAFNGCSGLTSIEIPNSVTSIGDLAFEGCSGLTSVIIDNSVTPIGEQAFSGCSSLTSISIGSNVTSIGNSAFYNCIGLTSIVIPSSVTSIGSYAFQNCKGLTSIEIPNGVSSIGNSAFESCWNLTSVTIPNSVVTIGSDAFKYSYFATLKIGITTIQNWFSGNTNLTKIVMTDGVQTIMNDAFKGCSKVNSIEIPSSVSNIGNNAFSGCEELTKVIIPDLAAWCSVNITKYSTQYIDFSYGYPNNPLYTAHHLYVDEETEIKNLVIPNGVSSINADAFAGCNELTSVTLPSSVSKIRDRAFYGCSNLSSIFLSNNVTVIGSGAFSGCSNLTTVTIDRVTPISIDASTFSNRENATLYVPAGSEEAYKSADYWKEFKAIKTIDPNVAVTGMSLTETNVSIDEIGKTHQLTATIVPSNATNKTVNWVSTNTDVCTVSSTGLVTATGEGECYVIATTADGGYTAYCTVSVTLVAPNVAVTGITLSPSVLNFKHVGGTKQIVANVLPADATNKSVNWMSATPTVCSVSETGLVTALGSGNGVVIATTVDGGKMAYCTINVTPTDHATITMGSNGIATFSDEDALNFTSVSGLKAYIASGYNPATGDLTMTRVYKVPAGEGLLVKGAAGSYDVPYEETSAYYANLLVGVPTATTVSPTDGDYTNFILANDAVKGIGFYPLVSSGEIGANKAYLQLPTSILPAASRSLRMVFDDEEDVTGIKDLNEKGAMRNEKFFDLQGRRVVKPTRGLYIKDGKKIMVK